MAGKALHVDPSSHPLAQQAGLCILCFPRGAANTQNNVFPNSLDANHLFLSRSVVWLPWLKITTLKEVPVLEIHGNNLAWAESIPPPQGYLGQGEEPSKPKSCTFLAPPDFWEPDPRSNLLTLQ